MKGKEKKLCFIYFSERDLKDEMEIRISGIKQPEEIEEELFRIDGIDDILATSSIIGIIKEEEAKWRVIEPKIIDVLKKFFGECRVEKKITVKKNESSALMNEELRREREIEEELDY